MDVNFENKYAYGEVCTILDWLGDDYKRKVPKNLLRLFKDERKFGYRPEIDFTKPLDGQVRQETKNIIAYLVHSCWLEDDNKKKLLEQRIEQNAAIEKERIKRERAEQRIKNTRVGLNAQLDNALKNLK